MESLEPARLDLETVLAQRTAELHEVRAQLQAVSQQLEQERCTRNDFLSMLVHEVRNPMASLRSGFSLLQRASVTGRDGEALAAQVHPLIERQLGHLARLMEALGDLARAREGSLALRRDPFPLQSAIELAAATAQPYLATQTQSVQLDPAQHAAACVLGDRPRVAQALAELLIEVSRRVPAGSVIRVATCLAAGRAAVVMFEGDGEIAEHRPQALPQQPPRDQDLLHDGGGAAGIGLALARHVFQLHGGQAWAREGHANGGGGGCVFAAELPLAPDPVPGT